MTFDEIKQEMTPELAVNTLMLWALNTWADDAAGKDDTNPIIEEFTITAGRMIPEIMNKKFADCKTSEEEGFILAAAYLQVKEAVDRLNDLEY